MAKRYLVKVLIWSNPLGRYVIPGEVITLSDEAAAPLLLKNAIESIEEELENGTDD